MKWDRIRRGCLPITLSVITLLPGCGPDDQRTDTAEPDAATQERASWPAPMAAQVDSGNAAVRADDFEAARRHFATATALAPEVAAGWFGLYLAEQELGRAEEAADALERARAIESRASLIHHEPDGSGPDEEP